MSVTIAIAAHKPCELPNDSLYVGVQAGAALHDHFLPITDDSGDNISQQNPYFCELTVLYWAWKNLKSDYIGLAHYRRHFRGKGKTPMTLEQAEAVLAKTPILLPKQRNYYIETMYSHYAHTLDPEPLDETGRILAEKYPEYVKEFERLKTRRGGHMFNMLVMRRDLLDEYCTWLFDVLNELMQRVDVSKYDEFHARFSGRIGELLLDVFLYTKGYAFEEVPFYYTEKVNWFCKGMGFLEAKFLGKKYNKSF